MPVPNASERARGRDRVSAGQAVLPTVYAVKSAHRLRTISWNCEPQPPEQIGPWFLWKLLIYKRHEGALPVAGDQRCP
jgi:hypothetical protein